MTQNIILYHLGFETSDKIAGGSAGARLFKLYPISINRLLLQSISINEICYNVAPNGEGDGSLLP